MRTLKSLLALALTAAGSAKVEVTSWLGQAAFKIVSRGGKTIVTAPWLRRNPLARGTAAQLVEAMNAGKSPAQLILAGPGQTLNF